MSYKLGIPKIRAEVPSGTSMLLLGDLFSGKDIFSKQFVSEGLKNGEACILISTNETVGKVLDDLGDVELENLCIINCIPNRFRTSNHTPTPKQVRYADSPADLTMIMTFTMEFLDLFSVNKEIKNIRVILDSVSTLLMYSNLKTVFKFLHVFTNTLIANNCICLLTMEEGAHDEIEIKAIQQLNQAVIRMSDGKIQMKGFAQFESEYEVVDDEIILEK